MQPYVLALIVCSLAAEGLGCTVWLHLCLQYSAIGLKITHDLNMIVIYEASVCRIMNLSARNLT